MTDRILARDGNVIAADFRPQEQLGLNLTFDSHILFCDDAVCLLRITYYLNGQHIGTQHVMAETPPINNTDVTP